MKYEIIPACMPERFDHIEETVALVRHNTKTIQLDLMDGKYVPEATWPFMYKTDFNLEDLKKEDTGFPFWENIDYELDLMVEKPEENLETWLSIGASRVIFHYGSIADIEKIKNIDIGMRSFVSIGIAVTVHDELEKIKELVREGVCDFIQVMGIEHIGYMGEPFDNRSLTIIRELKKDFPNLSISVDGGVSVNTITEFRDAGAERFVSGSGVFHGGVPSENIEYFHEILENTTQ